MEEASTHVFLLDTYHPKEKSILVMGLFILVAFFLLFVSAFAQTQTLKINTTSAVAIAQSISQQVQRFFTTSYIAPVLRLGVYHRYFFFRINKLFPLFTLFLFSNNEIIEAASTIGPAYANPFMTANYNISANSTLQYLVWTAFKSDNYCPINI